MAFGPRNYEQYHGIEHSEGILRYPNAQSATHLSLDEYSHCFGPVLLAHGSTTKVNT